MPGNPLHLVKSKIAHLRHASGAHDLHSPFVYQLYQEVIRKRKKSLSDSIETLRKEVLKSDDEIEVVDFKTGKKRVKTLGQEVRSSPSTPLFSAFLKRLLDFLEVDSALETGTSLGFNALYMAESKVKKVWTIEGNTSIASLAQEHFARMGSEKIHQVVGNIHDMLKSTIEEARPEVIFLDADHRSEAIQQCLEYINNHLNSVKCIIIHDIYWSKDMTSHWEKLIHESKYPLTLDVFQAGLLFPNMELEKQHFRLKF